VLGEDLTVELQVDPALPPVLGDPGQVEQVLLNLALNARDAMPDGGRLTIAAARGPAEIPGRPRPSTGTVRLWVSDTGAGMTPEVQARIFEPFFTTKGSGKGTGLGLATVHAIVTQHGGTVTVRSAPGQGTTFDVLLPAAEGVAVLPVETQRPVAVGGNGETIVLVEDDAGVRDVARRILGRLGYRVLAAGDAATGLDLLSGASRRVDLLVTDVVMPGMSGPELAARARDVRPDLPVLFVSGYPDRPEAEGQGPLLAKPFTPDALADCVRRALFRAA
jgi:CheY-like chemotaxis protein